MSILLISEAKFWVTGWRDLTGWRPGSSARIRACRQRKERNGTCCYCSNCGLLSVLPMYTLYLPSGTTSTNTGTFCIWKIQHMRWVGRVTWMEDYETVHNFGRKPERKRPLWSPRRTSRWGNNIKDDATEVKLCTLTLCSYYVNKSWNLMKGKNKRSEWKDLSFSVRCKDSILKSLFLYDV